MSRGFPPIVFLASTRVTLRPLLREDLPLLIRWINTPEVRENLTSYRPMMEANEQEWFEKLHRDTHNIVVVIVVGGKPIGTMGIHGINWKDRTATTGALIGIKEYWSKGYGTEAKMLLLSYAFNTLGLRKIKSSVIAFNTRSARYSEKCGYKPQGVWEKEVYVKGRYWDLIHLAVFREDWEPLWEEFSQKHAISLRC